MWRFVALCIELLLALRYLGANFDLLMSENLEIQGIAGLIALPDLELHQLHDIFLAAARSNPEETMESLHQPTADADLAAARAVATCIPLAELLDAHGVLLIAHNAMSSAEPANEWLDQRDAFFRHAMSGPPT